MALYTVGGDPCDPDVLGPNQSQSFEDLFSGNSADPFAKPQDALPSAPADSLNPTLIPDGFAYNVHLKFLPYRAHAMQLRMLDTLRRQALSGIWQPRWYTVPQDARVSIVAGDTLYYEQRVAQGAILWGYNFAAYQAQVGPPTLIPAPVADLRISLLDVANQWEITAGARSSQYVIGSAFRPYAAAGGMAPTTPVAGFPFVFMPQPYVVSGQGLLGITIVNTASASRVCQILLMCMEPLGVPR